MLRERLAAARRASPRLAAGSGRRHRAGCNAALRRRGRAGPHRPPRDRPARLAHGPLRAQLGAEPLGERGDDPLAQAASRPRRRACARATGTRPRRRSTCGPRRPARRGRRRRRGSRAARARRPRAPRRRASPAGTSSSHDERDVLPDGRVGDHVLVGHRLARAGEERRRGRARTRPTCPRAARGCSSPTTPASRARRLARVEERALGALERRLGLERRVERLDDALRAQEAALDDARRRGRARPAARRRGGRRARSRTARSAARPRRRCAAPPRRGSGAASSAAPVSSTEIGSGSFHVGVVVGPRGSACTSR